MLTDAMAVILEERKHEQAADRRWTWREIEITEIADRGKVANAHDGFRRKLARIV